MIQNALTIVMYHYVRPIAGSPYPDIKGLEAKAFEGQLDYLERHYRPIAPDEIVKSIREGLPLPEKAALLTFDDGYKDHIRHVYPRLKARGWKGVFFPPTACIESREMLDVNRIHFILAAVADKAGLVAQVEEQMLAAKGEFGLESLESYRKDHRAANRFDGADIIYVKRLLQHALPEALRARIAKDLFSRHVSRDEKAFADDLYMDGGDLREMADGGMEIGCHGHKHYWLARLGAKEQAQDIDRSLAYLAGLGLRKDGFWFCYPYGSFNQDTLGLLAERKCAAAVTTAVGLADFRAGRPLEMPRLDTNDLPRSGDGAPCSWTMAAEQG